MSSTRFILYNTATCIQIDTTDTLDSVSKTATDVCDVYFGIKRTIGDNDFLLDGEPRPLFGKTFYSGSVTGSSLITFDSSTCVATIPIDETDFEYLPPGNCAYCAAFGIRFNGNACFTEIDISTLRTVKIMKDKIRN